MHKQLAVLGVHDCLDGSAEHLYIIFLKNTGAIQLHATVESRLSAKGKQDAVGLLLLYDLLHKIRGHGKEIYLVGKTLGCLHRRDIGVDEHRSDTLLLHRFKSLRA